MKGAAGLAGMLRFETGGIAVLRIRLPEPQKWILLAAGLSLLGGLYRMRER